MPFLRNLDLRVGIHTGKILGGIILTILIQERLGHLCPGKARRNQKGFDPLFSISFLAVAG